MCQHERGVRALRALFLLFGSVVAPVPMMAVARAAFHPSEEMVECHASDRTTTLIELMISCKQHAHQLPYHITILVKGELLLQKL